MVVGAAEGEVDLGTGLEPSEDLDEKHFLYNEEDDFCRRTRKLGKKICYFPETSVKHLLGQSTHQPGIRERVIIETYKSNLYFYSKYYSATWNIILRFIYKLTFSILLLRPYFQRCPYTMLLVRNVHEVCSDTPVRIEQTIEGGCVAPVTFG